METLFFDRNDSLASVLEDFARLCAKVGIEDASRLVGEDVIRTFHSSLVESAGLGNQARFEKIIGSGTMAIKVVAAHSRHRGLRAFLAQLLGR